MAGGGRPRVPRQVEREFWRGVASGLSTEAAATGVGVSLRPGLSLTDDRETLLDLLTLGALDLVRWAIDQRPDLVAEIARASRSLIQSPSPI